MWPRGDPLPALQCPMKSIEDISKGLAGFVKYWENLCNANVTGEYRRRYEHLVHYWRDVKAVLEDPLPISNVLKDGFWPTTRVQASVEDQVADDREDHEEFGEDEAYVGPLRGRLQPSFRVGRDLYEGYFVAVRPADGDT